LTYPPSLCVVTGCALAERGLGPRAHAAAARPAREGVGLLRQQRRAAPAGFCTGQEHTQLDHSWPKSPRRPPTRPHCTVLIRPTTLIHTHSTPQTGTCLLRLDALANELLSRAAGQVISAFASVSSQCPTSHPPPQYWAPSTPTHTLSYTPPLLTPTHTPLPSSSSGPRRRGP
jgi:hypothetical protein